MSNEIFLKNVVSALKVVIKMCESKIVEEGGEVEHVIVPTPEVIAPAPVVIAPVPEMIGGKEKWSSYRRSNVRTDEPRGYMSWNRHEDFDLKTQYYNGNSVNSLKVAHGRTFGAIQSRLKHNGYMDCFGRMINV
jgi:hypothetical protein